MKTQIDMSELHNIPKNGYNVISTFSGCGGSSLGYKLSGYNVLCALEFMPKAAEIYRLNFPNTPVLTKDIREITGNDLLNMANIKPFELDILDGSPPCCAFSVNGIREKGWGKVRGYSLTKQRVDDLFFEYIRIVKDLMPKVFVAENVKGLTMGTAKEILNEIVEMLSDIGYIVKYKVLNAKDYLVPQTRERLILIGVRKDLHIKPVFPKPIYKIISTKEAIEDLIDEECDVQISDKQLDYLNKYFYPKIGDSAMAKIVKENDLHIYSCRYHRARWELPFYTLMSDHSRVVHPIKNRLLSINEAKRLQTFPDDFKLVHSPTQNWERIGRAVPPNLMKSVSKTIQTEILDNIPKNYKITKEEFDERYRNSDRKMGVQHGSYKLF